MLKKFWSKKIVNLLDCNYLIGEVKEKQKRKKVELKNLKKPSLIYLFSVVSVGLVSSIEYLLFFSSAI